jgi:DNA-binding beta-propeller fold protein YncE
VYVASSTSDAITVFKRDPATGKLTQATGRAGCIAAGGAHGCASAVGLDGPNSVAVSADGRNVYATSFGSNSIAIFRRSRSGALRQAMNSTGCIAAVATRHCATARALLGPDVVTVAPDGRDVYVGSFVGNAVVVLARSPSNGTLTQPSGTNGCIAEDGVEGCAPGFALDGPEGLAVSPDGSRVYAAAASSGALDAFNRNPSTGGLSQATDQSGCLAEDPLAGCADGRQLGGADAVAVSPDGNNEYVTALVTNSVANVTRDANSGQLQQDAGTTGCAIYLIATACTLGRTLVHPEGVAVSPDGASAYTVSIGSGSIDVFDRTAATGGLMQKPRRAGCLVSRPMVNCTLARALRGASSVTVSPDGRNVYVVAFGSNALDVFKRLTRR